MKDQPTPSSDLYCLATTLQDIREYEAKLERLYQDRDARLARLAEVVEHGCLVRTGCNTKLVELIRYSDKLTARLVGSIYGSDLPNAYPDSPSHSVNPDVPIVSLADLDATEVA